MLYIKYNEYKLNGKNNKSPLRILLCEKCFQRTNLYQSYALFSYTIRNFHFTQFSPPRVEFRIRLFIQTFCGHENGIFVKFKHGCPLFFSVLKNKVLQIYTLKETGNNNGFKMVSQHERFYILFHIHIERMCCLRKKNTLTLSTADKVANHHCWPAQFEMYFVPMSNKNCRSMTSGSLFHWRKGSETDVENFIFFICS